VGPNGRRGPFGPHFKLWSLDLLGISIGKYGPYIPYVSSSEVEGWQLLRKESNVDDNEEVGDNKNYGSTRGQSSYPP
jgi:hypothetical protein